MNRIKLLFTFVAILLLSSVPVSAQTSEKGATSETYVYLILAALLFTLAMLFASIMIFDTRERKEIKVKVKPALVLGKVMEDHEYDGIQELDNPAPAWFQFLFYITIVFAVIYMIVYHVAGSNNLSADEYNREMALANAQKEELAKTGGLINESNVTSLIDEADLTKGKELFVVNCASCHGNSGEGIVGPNLTDDYWIHGGGIKNVFATVKNGVPAKGMIAWQTQLNPKQMQQVSSYVLTLHGTKPPNGKPPEGNIWIDSSAVNNDTLKKTQN